jgi:hypothetical protein
MVSEKNTEGGGGEEKSETGVEETRIGRFVMKNARKDEEGGNGEETESGEKRNDGRKTEEESKETGEKDEKEEKEEGEEKNSNKNEPPAIPQDKIHIESPGVDVVIEELFDKQDGDTDIDVDPEQVVNDSMFLLLK